MIVSSRTRACSLIQKQAGEETIGAFNSISSLCVLSVIPISPSWGGIKKLGRGAVQVRLANLNFSVRTSFFGYSRALFILDSRNFEFGNASTRTNLNFCRTSIPDRATILGCVVCVFWAVPAVRDSGSCFGCLSHCSCHRFLRRTHTQRKIKAGLGILRPAKRTKVFVYDHGRSRTRATAARRQCVDAWNRVYD